MGGALTASDPSIYYFSIFTDDHSECDVTSESGQCLTSGPSCKSFANKNDKSNKYSVT